MSEAKLEAACVRYAKSQGWLHAKLDPKGNVGVPDHVFFGPGKYYPTVIVVEFKYGRNSQTEKQRAWAQKYSDLFESYAATATLGEHVWVIRTLEEFRRVLG